MPAEYLPIAIGLTIFLALLMAIIGVLQMMRVGARKREFLQRAQVSGRGVIVRSAPSKDGPLMGLLSRLGRQVTRRKTTDVADLRPRFLKAGLRSDKAPTAFWGAKAILAVALPAGFIMFRVLVPHILISPLMSIVIITVLALAGFYAPNLWLLNRIQNRRQIILEGFPDALDLLVVCVEAGMGLDSAISRVAKESYSSNQTLADELNLFNLELRAGMPRQDALKNLARRTDLEQMQNLVTLLIQTDKFGTSVSQALKVFSETMRTQRFQRAEEKAAKIPIKLLFPLILFIFPALFVAILGPAIIRISQTLMQM